MKIKINVTKEILRQSMNCPVCNKVTPSNCAVALAVRDIFPNAEVSLCFIYPFGFGELYTVELPIHVSLFISAFDKLHDQPEKRLALQGHSFDVDVSEFIIDKIGIDEVHRILSESKTLELVQP